MASWVVRTASVLAVALGAAAAWVVPARPGVRFQMVQLEPRSFPQAAAVPLRNSYHLTDLAANRLVFIQPQVRLTVEYGPPGWPHGSLVIAGLNHPELQIRADTRLDILLVNLSNLGAVMLGLTTHGPPFAHQPILPNPWENGFRQSSPGRRGWSHAVLSRESGETVYAAHLAFRVTGTGSGFYLNDAQDAANFGEYGRITVVP